MDGLPILNTGPRKNWSVLQIKYKNKVTHLEYNTMHGYMRNKMYKDEIESTFNEIRLFLGDENE